MNVAATAAAAAAAAAAATAYLVQCTLSAIANSAKANQRHKYQTSTINAMVPGRKVALPLEGIVPILL